MEKLLEILRLKFDFFFQKLKRFIIYEFISHVIAHLTVQIVEKKRKRKLKFERVSIIVVFQIIIIIIMIIGLC